jgi:diguanylate cyclase (GGDEF)-like protein
MAGGFILVTLDDITNEKQIELELKKQNVKLLELADKLTLSTKKLKKLAYSDHLTGLKNKLYFKERIKSHITKNPNGVFGVLILDLDNLKRINSAFGRQSGDEIIKHSAEVLTLFQHSGIEIFRLGDDEFLILVLNLEEKVTMLTIGDTIVETLSNENIRASGGIAIYPSDSTDIVDLIKFADIAASNSKMGSRQNITFFRTYMQEKILSEINIETKMTTALKTNKFQLFFQPQYNTADNSLRGFEALLRWYDDNLGWINPETFIPIAEESLKIIPLGNWIIETALSTLKKWQMEFNFNGIMSINVSPIQIKQNFFVDQLSDQIKSMGIHPDSIEIEITEGVMIENLDYACSIIQQIKTLGVRISLDDFGTGYATFSYLQNLPLDTLKIDRTFIDKMKSTDSIETDIIGSIVSMMNKRHITTVAEGVETAEQMALLKSINCTTVQGFLKGKPMPQSRCEELFTGMSSPVRTGENKKGDQLSFVLRQ